MTAAPFSQLAVLGNDPPVLGVAVNRHPTGALKETGRNILAGAELVANLVSSGIAEAMNVTCIDAPEGVSKLELARLATSPSLKVAPPRISASPVSLECCLLTVLSFGPSQGIVLARIVHAHVADEHVLDAERCLIDTPGLGLIGGMHGGRWYARTTDLFAMDRPSWAQWKDEGKV